VLRCSKNRQMKPTKLGNGKVEVIWDYDPPQSERIMFWEVTIITKINQISANCHKYYGRLGIPRPNAPLNVPMKFKELITTHPYYKEETGLLSGKYNVKFIETDDDFLELDGFMVQIINFK
jgi:hypothetical protein